MKTRPNSNSTKIRNYLTRHPNANPKDVASRFNCSVALVYQLRKSLRDTPIKFLPQKVTSVEAPVEEAPAGDETSNVEIEHMLRERGDRYGPFENHAKITQMLKDVMRSEPGWDRMTYPQREALEMVVHKIGRILNGDPTYEDSVVDIIGYTDLMLRCMRGKNEL